MNEQQPKQYAAHRSTIEEQLGDIRTALLGDDMSEKLGLIRRVGNVERRLGEVEGRLSTVEHQLLDITELITIRNEENRGKIHVTWTQLIVFIVFLLLVILVLAPWLQAHLVGGAVDGRIGFALSLLFAG